MSWSLRRVVLTLGLVTFLCAATFITQAVGQAQVAQPGVQVKVVKQPLQKGGPGQPGQPGQPAPPPADPTEFSHAIDLPKNPDAVKKIEAIKDYVNEQDWETACRAIQSVLTLDRDYFMRVERKGVISWVSVKSEADRILSEMEPGGKDHYKLTFGPAAAEDLKKAKASSSVEQLTTIMRFYLHTDAGADATNLLGTYLLDRGEWTAAALCYEKLLGREGSDRLSPVTLFKAAYAFRMVGDAGHEKECWDKLNTRRNDITFPGSKEPRSVDDLREYLTKTGRPATELALFDDTHYVGGAPSRSAQARNSGPAFLERDWYMPTARSQETRDWIKDAEKRLVDRGVPLVPAAQPITATVLNKDNQKLSLVVFRSHYGIHAADLKTGKLKWETPSTYSLDRMVRNTKQVGNVSQWVNAHLQTRPNLLLENSTVGTLSTDGTFVFAVDDLAIPPGNVNPNQFDPQGRGMTFGGDLDEAVAASRLQAFSLATGKIMWQVGGKTGKDDKKDDLADSYFLGAPLPLGGKLFVLVEKQQDLRLATLDPLTGKLLGPVQTLATARDKMTADVWRRIQATHLAYGEGILVCPTNAGAILGVDLLSGSLVWAYPYRDKSDPNSSDEVWDPRFGGRRGGVPPGWVQGPDGRWYNPNINTKWKVSPPVIVDGKVVFTAPDANAIHCINLRDGSAVWTQQRRADDLYLAGVFAGKAVIVGKGYARAVSLAKGEDLWRVDTGTPSGYGIAGDNVYYLPLKDTPKGNGPGICAIDVEKGQVKGLARARKKSGDEAAVVPGNLVFFDGEVLSQTATEMTAFPQLEVQIAKSTEELKKNPNSPEGLFIRGQLRLDKGDLGDAIDDLRKALKNNPDAGLLPKVREKLYDSMTEYFQRDFNKAEEYLKEYEELCKVEGASSEPAKLEEQRRRRANFLCLVAKGKEAQGKLVEAFERYQQFAAEAADLDKQEPIPTVDEPNVKARPDVWSGGRIAAMVAKATPENRKPLEDLITKRWDELKKTEDINELRNFVRVFGSLFAVGKEARLELANRLMDDSSPTALLEAEQHLSLLRVPGEDPKLSGRAVETLARLNTRKGLLEDASYYYRLLRDQYAKVPVRDGKTGAELFNDMATDKRLLPHLDVPSQFGITGKHIKVDEQRGNFPYNQQVYEFGHSGEPLPFFQSHKLGLRLDYHQLKITDRVGGDEKSKNLTRTNFANMIYSGQPNQPKYGFMTMGHLVVLPLAHMVYGIDPVRGEVLWEVNLYGEKQVVPGQPGPGAVPTWNQFIVDPKDNSVQVFYTDGWVQRIGGAGTLEGNALCLHTRDSLTAIDPVTGKVLWTRSGVSSRCQTFNDDQYVYVVEMDNNSQAASTRVLRAYDGVSVNVPDFAALYNKRVRQVGRNLLLSENDGKGQMTYRLYDVLTGKDVWTASYAANSVVLKSEEPNFGGVVEPDGTVRVTDVRTGKEAMKAKMDPKFLEKMVSVHLLYDGQYFFVACNGPIDPNQNPWGGVQTNLVPNTGMRALSVNGEVYAFDAQTGKTKWHTPMPNQQIILEHFADMPVVLATSRYGKWVQVGAGKQPQQVVALESIVKSNGKYVFKGENQQWPQFHALNLDPKKGTIELVGYTTKLVHTVSNDPPPEKK
jgi:outer membrane protein assembly factor BamB/tetratricopeptide (TPR) repeat protein